MENRRFKHQKAIIQLYLTLFLINMSVSFCLEGMQTTKAAKKQSVSLLPLRFCITSWIIFRGARQKQLTSCDHDDGGKPVHGGRSLSTFSHGNHACSHGDGCGAEMFFSFYS